MEVGVRQGRESAWESTSQVGGTMCIKNSEKQRRQNYSEDW